MRLRTILRAGVCGLLLAGAAVGPAAAGNAATGLEDAAPCPEIVTFTCGYLTVPLDREGRVPGTLRLQAAVAGNTQAPRGTLLLLTGGPGQPGVSLVPRITQRIGYLLDDYRLVMIDQRGTGSTAIDCPQLQLEAGSSDITPATPAALQECATILGESRNFYTTSDTVADLEALRRALGVRTWTIDGVSYGTFVGEHYALTYPERVSRLVLDSVVPQDGAETFYGASLARTAFVLRKACEEQSCGFDPAADLAQVVRQYGIGVGVMDLIVIASIVDPKLVGPPAYFPVLDLLHLAAQGDPEPLKEAITAIQGGAGLPPADYSAGLHVATICADLTDAPWGDSTAPVAGRAEDAARAVHKIDTWPYDEATALGQGIAHACALWVPSRANVSPKRHKLTMPVLLLAGDRDLSTPLAWAQEETKHTTVGTLVVVAGMGHSIQGRNADGDAAVRAFLLA
jgi:pimeloyl-ACP methyl ester carboxylesterase